MGIEEIYKGYFLSDGEITGAGAGAQGERGATQRAGGAAGGEGETAGHEGGAAQGAGGATGRETAVWEGGTADQFIPDERKPTG
jgi:hypothetical protein